MRLVAIVKQAGGEGESGASRFTMSSKAGEVLVGSILF